MKFAWKRILSITLTALMLISCLPMTAITALAWEAFTPTFTIARAALYTVRFVDTFNGSELRTLSNVSSGYELVSADVPSSPVHAGMQFSGWATVIYTTTPELPDIPLIDLMEYGTPLGLGAIVNNLGDCFD